MASGRPTHENRPEDGRQDSQPQTETCSPQKQGQDVRAYVLFGRGVPHHGPKAHDENPCRGSARMSRTQEPPSQPSGSRTADQGGQPSSPGESRVCGCNGGRHFQKMTVMLKSSSPTYLPRSLPLADARPSLAATYGTASRCSRIMPGANRVDAGRTATVGRDQPRLRGDPLGSLAHFKPRPNARIVPPRRGTRRILRVAAKRRVGSLWPAIGRAPN